MRALLLAGGLGTRLRPLTETVPKCLVPIGGRPLLDIWLELLDRAGIERVLVNTHHLADVVRAHVAASVWRDRIDLVHEPELLGTGGTVLANRDWMAQAWRRGAPVLVAHADNLTDLDPARLAARHAARPAGVEITMLAFHTDDPRSCGILDLDGEDRVVAFHEKVADPPGTLANAAVYVFEPAVPDLLAELAATAPRTAAGQPVLDLSTQVIPRFLGRILAVEHTGYHRDIGTPESLALAEAEFPAYR